MKILTFDAVLPDYAIFGPTDLVLRLGAECGTAFKIQHNTFLGLELNVGPFWDLREY